MSAELFFVLKNIKYFGSNRMILLQNENGPCPLLAVANALLLENKLKGIHEDQGYFDIPAYFTSLTYSLTRSRTHSLDPATHSLNPATHSFNPATYSLLSNLRGCYIISINCFDC